jgi:hypothetical protein
MEKREPSRKVREIILSSICIKGSNENKSKVLFKNIFKIAAFFPFENSLPHGFNNKDLQYFENLVFIKYGS